MEIKLIIKLIFWEKKKIKKINKWKKKKKNNVLINNNTNYNNKTINNKNIIIHCGHNYLNKIKYNISGDKFIKLKIYIFLPFIVIKGKI